jgi:cell division protein FtsW
MQKKSVYFLIMSVAILVVIGCVMLFSTSAFAQDSHGNPNFFIKRQFIWLGVGCVACVVASLVDYHLWGKYWWVWFGGAVLLLALCFIPPIGQRINGSARWLNLGVASFQPSEMGKFAAVVVLAWWFAREEVDASSFLRGFVYPIAITGILMGPRCLPSCSSLAPACAISSRSLRGGSPPCSTWRSTSGNATAA